MRKLFYFFPAIFFAVLMTGCAVREYFWTPVEPGTAFIRESRTTEPAIADSSVAEVPKDESTSASLFDIFKTATPTPASTPTPTPSPTPTPVPTEPIPEGMGKSILTGEYISADLANRRPVGFMIDNVTGAYPQSGVSQADLYIEAVVEGSLTRFCALFDYYDDLPRIGPLRSCRDYFLSIAAGFDEIYEHYGQAAYAFPYLESDDVDNISGLAWYAGKFFYRDNTFHRAPHNAYISGAKINEAIDFLGYRKTHNEDFKPQLNYVWVGDTSPDLEGGRPAKYFAPGFLINKPWFVYQEETGTYLRYQYGDRHYDVENNKQLEVKNIIVEFQNYDYYQTSQYLHYDTTAGGKGLYISDGKCIDITWERPSFYEPVTYRTLSGEELNINTGKTWICLVQNQYIRNCVIGEDSQSAVMAVTEEEAAEAEVYNAEWKAAYKWGEDVYLTIMNQEKERNLAAHGGRSKVEG
ncbi:MAG: DUF3048 domain-containing protein [Lachnospiraceae bacterium]|nr:DUF3048 domain-containing protein [Lachnospiraceae bacterium]